MFLVNPQTKDCDVIIGINSANEILYFCLQIAWNYNTNKSSM